MKTLLLACLLFSSAAFAKPPVYTDKVNNELFGAVEALSLPPCDTHQHFSCSTTVRDLFCKVAGGVHELDNDAYHDVSAYACSYTVSDHFAPEASKTIGVEGVRAQALYTALQHAGLKPDCDQFTNQEGNHTCNTRMQNIKCGEEAIGKTKKRTCEVIPKYPLTQAAPPRSAHQSGAVVFDRKTGKASHDGCNGNWTCEGVLNLGGKEPQDGAFGPDYGKTAR